MSHDPTQDASELAAYIVDELKAASSLALEGVFYGDQELVPAVPCACVETASRSKAPTDAGITSDIGFSLTIMLYHSSSESNEQNRYDCDVWAERVAAKLEEDRQKDGLVVHSWVSDIDYGYALRNKTRLRAAKITLVAVTRGRL